MLGGNTKVVSTKLVQRANACIWLPDHVFAPITTPSGLPPPTLCVNTSSCRKRKLVWPMALVVKVGCRLNVTKRIMTRTSTW